MKVVDDIKFLNPNDFLAISIVHHAITIVNKSPVHQSHVVNSIRRIWSNTNLIAQKKSTYLQIID